MPTNICTQRENALALLGHRRPAWLDTEVNMIFPREILDNVARGFVADALPFSPQEDAGGLDMFGVRWVYEPEARGSMVPPGAPLLETMVDWRETIAVPDPEALPWDDIARRCLPLVSQEKLNGTMVFTGFFERLISLLDFENAAVALIDEDEEDAIRDFFQMLVSYYTILFQKLHTCCGIDIVTFHDDWGHQRGTFFSERVCRNLLLPYLKATVDACHQAGMYFDFHCCGKVESFVPLMIEAGVDKWDGQLLNDIFGLLERYGSQLVVTYNFKCPDLAGAEAEAWAAELVSCLPEDPAKGLWIPARGLSADARTALKAAWQQRQ